MSDKLQFVVIYLKILYADNSRCLVTKNRQTIRRTLGQLRQRLENLIDLRRRQILMVVKINLKHRCRSA